jgi:hypothetical protein
MTISVNYQKRKNVNLFNKFQSNKVINISSVQNYIPIYDKFFSLNTSNFNSINLNHKWHISDIKEPKNYDTDDERIFYCKLKNISEDEDLTNSQKVFFKMAPLLDPFKYLVGKYNHNDVSLFNLPSLDGANKIHPKIADSNNSSYIDGFFSYLTSKTLHEHNFLHGLDYYGSFLAIKNDYKINIIDDLDYLIQSDFFNKQQNNLFKVEDYSHLITNTEIPQLVPLKISNSLKSNRSILSIKSIDESLFENIFETKNETPLSLEDVKNMKVELEDITHSTDFDIKNQKKSETLKSGSTCSSRTSHTNDDDLSDIENKNENEIGQENTSKYSGSESEFESGSGSENFENEENSDSDSDFDTEEETLNLTFPKFPVQVICLEHCENTFDDLIINGELKEEEWFSALMQIVMTLITYQKMFAFTHNDLHTNNIMYIHTNKKFLYYVYKKKTYKVPTYGKIYKIIDDPEKFIDYNI